jgi:hypothetical protein
MLFREFGAVNLQNFFEKCTKKALREYLSLGLHFRKLPKVCKKTGRSPESMDNRRIPGQRVLNKKGIL